MTDGAPARKKMVRLSAVDKECLFALFDNGESIHMISRELNVTRPAVIYWLKKRKAALERAATEGFVHIDVSRCPTIKAHLWPWDDQ